MAIYIDNVRILWRGRRWCHMVAENLDELHQFASRLGLKREWFQDSASYPHYDVTVETKAVALQIGAIEGDRITMISCARLLKDQLEARNNIEQYIQLTLDI